MARWQYFNVDNRQDSMKNVVRMNLAEDLFLSCVMDLGKNCLMCNSFQHGKHISGIVKVFIGLVLPGAYREW